MNIEGPDGKVIEFPDTMEHGQVESAMAKLYPKDAKPEKNSSYLGDLADNVKGIGQNIEDLATGNFETPLNAKMSKNSDALAGKLLQASDHPDDPSISNLLTGTGNTQPADYAKLFNEKVAANPFSKSGNTLLSVMRPAVLPIATAAERYGTPAIAKATGADPETVRAMENIPALVPGMGKVLNKVPGGTLPEQAKAAYSATKTGAKALGNAASTAGDAIGEVAKPVAAKMLLEPLRKGFEARTPEDLDKVIGNMKQTSSASYQQMRDAGAIPTQASIDGVISNIDAEVGKTGIVNSSIHGSYVQAMNALKERAKQGNMSLEELDQYRQLLSEVANDNTTKIDGANSTAKKAITAIEALDDSVEKMTGTDLSTGDTKAIDALMAGRAQWAKARKFQQVADVIRRSDGDANYVKREIKKLTDDPKKMRGYTKQEVELLKKAGKLSTMEGILKMAGKFGIDFGGSRIGNTALPVVGGFAATHAAGPIVGGGLVGAASAARYGQKLLARGKVEDALQAIENRPVPNGINNPQQNLPSNQFLPPRP